MKIRVRAISLAGVLVVALYDSQPIQDWLSRVKAGYEQTQQQRTLVVTNSDFATTKSVLQPIMAAALSDNPSFSRVRVAAIRNQVTTDLTTPLVFDLVSSSAVAGHVPGDVVINVPIAQMSDYLGSLLKQECAFVPTGAISDLSTVARMRSLSIAAFLACPILNEKGELLGVIYGTWDSLTEVPDDLEPIKKRLMKSGKVIGMNVKLVN
jgi:hypothetical protein